MRGIRGKWSSTSLCRIRPGVSARRWRYRLSAVSNQLLRMEDTSILEPAKLGARIAGRESNRAVVRVGALHGRRQRHGKLIGGMLQSASCFKNRCMSGSSCYSMTNFRRARARFETGFGLFGSWCGNPDIFKNIVCRAPFFSGLKQHNESGYEDSPGSSYGKMSRILKSASRR